MTESDTLLAGDRAAVAALLAAAVATGALWNVPRAPGKWSPSQTVEHVTRIMDESAKVAEGVPSKFPNLPFFLKPLVRIFFLTGTLERNAFPDKSKTIKELDPESGSATPADARVKLEAVLARFEQAIRARASSGQRVKSSLFGAVTAEKFAKFQELHVRHHLEQMPGGRLS